MNNELKKRHWFKRAGMAILIPLLLCLAAVILLIISGGGKIFETIDTILNSIWLPLTLVRAALYIIVAYQVFPFFIKRKSKKNDELLEYLFLKQQEVVDENDKLYISSLITNVEANRKAYSDYLKNRYLILLFFIFVDLFMIQLPFLLRG